MPDSATDPTPVSEADYADAEQSSTGFCRICREFTTGMCESDARNYKCDKCGHLEVFGAGEALIMELITIDETDDD